MSINSISDYFNQIAASKLNSASKINSSSSSSNDTSQSSQVDTVELGSDSSSLSSFLNYTANGNYSLPSLADYLNSDSGIDSTSLLGGSSNNSSNDIFSLMNNSNSSDSTDGTSSNSDDNIFGSIMQESSQYTNFVIQQALSKYEASKSPSVSSSENAAKNA